MLRTQTEPPDHYEVKGKQRLLWDDFCAFWEHYPHKVGRKPAWIAWKKLKPDHELQARIGMDVGKRIGESKKVWPRASTYLNQAWWEDERIGKSVLRDVSAYVPPLPMWEQSRAYRANLLRSLKSSGKPAPHWATQAERERHGWG